MILNEKRLKRRSCTPELLSRDFLHYCDLGKIFPRILREAGLTVERHDDHFDENTTDEVWLQEVEEGTG